MEMLHNILGGALKNLSSAIIAGNSMRSLGGISRCGHSIFFSWVANGLEEKNFLSVEHVFKKHQQCNRFLAILVYIAVSTVNTLRYVKHTKHILK